MKLSWLWFVTIFALTVTLLIIYPFSDGGDDAAYKKVSHNTSISEHVINQYYGWGGRVIPELLAYSVNGPLSMTWIITNALFVTMLFALLHYYSSLISKPLWWFYALGFLVLIAFPRDILEPAILWRTGSVNYLWPTVFGLTALLPFAVSITSRSNLSTRIKVLCGLGTVAAALSTEQVVITLLFLQTTSFIALLISKRQISKYLLSLFSITLIGGAVVLFAPGNNVRFIQEEMNHFPGFSSLSVANRISISIYWVVNKLMNELSTGLGIVLAMYGVLLVRMKGRLRIIGAIASGVGILMWLTGVINIHWTILPLTPESIRRLDVLGGYLLACAFMVILLSSMIVAINQYKKLWIGLVLFCAVVINLFLVTASPTMDVSGNRTLFVPVILLVLQALIVFSYIGKKKHNPNKV